ncbi:hypothetical protein, partial [uncultured Subdoligranulum sp.]|uniref:hypothetical protein n=1 Tax=uncultured Subdoligranulum sp. TaxID=512298 RepID=UPI002621D3C4
ARAIFAHKHSLWFLYEKKPITFKVVGFFLFCFDDSKECKISQKETNDVFARFPYYRQLLAFNFDLAPHIQEITRGIPLFIKILYPNPLIFYGKVVIICLALKIKEC